MQISLTTFGKMFGVAALGLSAFSVHAVPLVAGTNTALPGTTVAAEPQLAGTVLVDDLIPFSFSAGPSGGVITGIVQERVVQSTLDNTLDFYWRVMNDSSSAAAIGAFRVGNFMSPEYNANWRIDGLGDKAPDLAFLFPNPPNSGDVNFKFSLWPQTPGDGLLPGQSSTFFFFDTTATNYSKTAMFDLTGMGQNPISSQYAAYSPAAPVPEPQTYAMLLAGLGFISFMARRRKDFTL